MMCCSCPPCLEAATHLVCAVVVLLVVAMATSPSLFISSQAVVIWLSDIEKYEEVSVAVVW